MKPLSILKFIRGSGGKLFSLAISVTLAVTLLYFLSIIISHVVNQNVELNVNPLLNMSVISGTDVEVSKEHLDKDLDKLKGNKDIKGWYITSFKYIDLKTHSSSNNMFLFQLPIKDITTMMKWQKLKLTEGKIPENQGEVVLHKKLAANYSLRINDLVKKSTNGWNLNNDIKVVGIFEGPAIMGFEYVEENSLMLGNTDISVITLAADKDVTAMNRFIIENFGNRYEIRTIDMVKKIISEKNKNINFIIIFIGVIVVIVLSVLLGNICMIQYTQRSKEFELLYAIGYTKKYIAIKVFKEIGICTLLGYFVGLLLAMVIGWLMNIFLLDENLLGMSIVNVNNLLWILLVPILVTFSGMITPMEILKFRDIM
ncbi:MAG: ABC transporter permease [Clostridiaceae bacterium]|nr:ABC transporter permease [Clostridiaceae bacterium]